MPFSLPVRKESDEVYYADCGVVRLGANDLEELKRIALANPRKRSRLCTHSAPSDVMHEMFIVHAKDAYVRPHRHLLRREGLTVLEGEADMVIFDDDGKVAGAAKMNELDFYQRINLPLYHMLLIRSEFLVFHEATSGPFSRTDSEFAPWSPADDDPIAVRAFTRTVEGKVHTLLQEKTLG